MQVREKDIEKSVLQYLYHAGIFAFKYPTTGRYDTKKNTWIKTRGTITGVADIIMIMEEGKTVWLEIKSPKGKQTPNQIEFQRKLEVRGHKYLVIRSVQDLIDWLEDSR